MPRSISKHFSRAHRMRTAIVLLVVAACVIAAIAALTLRPIVEAQSAAGKRTQTTANTKKEGALAAAASKPGTTAPAPAPAGQTPTATGDAPAPTTTPTPAAAPQPASCSKQTRGTGLWVWQPGVATSAAERAAFFAFAQPKQVRTVYLESERLINTDQASLATFIREAKQRCIDVELLYGAAEWGFTRNHAYAVSLAQKSVAFAKQAAVPPVGIQFDVEPYNLAEFKADTNAGANQYLDLLEKIKGVTAQSNLYFAKAMPLGFEFRTVVRDGASTMLSHAVIDRVDRVVLMDYRDTASRIIADAADEVQYAGSAGKKVIIGTETSCDTGEVHTITFCEEGLAALATEHAKVQAHYGAHAGYGGLAIHDYTAYRALR